MIISWQSYCGDKFSNEAKLVLGILGLRGFLGFTHPTFFAFFAFSLFFLEPVFENSKK